MRKDTEFVTMLDLAQRIKAFEKAGFNYSFNSASNTMTATVTANQIGTFALDVEKGKTIASVSGWYAYDNDSVFMDADGGTLQDQAGQHARGCDPYHGPARRAPNSFPSRAMESISTSRSGRGEDCRRSHRSPRRELTVTGAEIESRNGNKLELTVSGNGDHNIAVKLKPAALNVALANDTGASVNDRVTSDGN